MYQNYKDNELTDAIFEDDYARVRSALEGGDNVTSLVDIEDLWVNDDLSCHECMSGTLAPERFVSPLQLAVRYSSYGVFRMVVESLPVGGDSINERGRAEWEQEHKYSTGTVCNTGRSALEIAVDLGLEEFIQLLLNKGASTAGHTDTYLGELNSLLDYAVHSRSRSQTIVWKLIESGEKFEFKHLIQAVNHNWAWMVDNIIESGMKDIGRFLYTSNNLVQPIQTDRETGRPTRVLWTLLDIALYDGYAEVAKILKSAGVLTSVEAQRRLRDSEKHNLLGDLRYWADYPQSHPSYDPRVDPPVKKNVKRGYRW